MNIILDFIPNHCPKCGEDIGHSTRLSEMDFLSGAPCSCKACGCHYQYRADVANLVEQREMIEEAIGKVDIYEREAPEACPFFWEVCEILGVKP